jgi:uncharacterized metal-binding protein
MNCADCDEQACYREGRDGTVIREEAEARCRDPEVARIMKVAATIESEGYGVLNRVEEVATFARSMGYRRLGIAFCIGLAEEARLLQSYYKKEGFVVESVCCKLGGIAKDSLDLPRLHPESDHEATCNPVGQALQLARAGTELNLVVGLCVGHDVLFTQHSAAPVTTLVVKDRVLGHNPAAALQTSYGRAKLGI